MATKSTKKRSTKKRVAKKTTKRKQTGTSSASGAARSLVIVESPAKARTITKYLPKGFTVKATVVGHGRHAKVTLFKMRRRKHFQKHAGHRQNFTEVRIDAIG